MELKAAAAPSFSAVGIHPEEVRRKLMNRTGSDTFVGQVLAVDLRSSATESGTKYGPEDSENGVFGNGVLPAAGTVKFGICAMVTEVVADNKIVNCIMRGIGSGFVLRAAGSGTVSAEDPLVVDTAGKLDATTAAGEKVFALFLAEDATIDGTGGTHNVLFDGLAGFGTA